MDETHHLLRHFLAVLAYRTQKALWQAPQQFGSFSAPSGVRTPTELLHHMGDLIDAAASGLRGEITTAPRMAGDLVQETERFHASLEELAELLRTIGPLKTVTVDRLLQGPLADAMTHTGQLAMLRRLAGSPVPAENFFRAAVNTDNVTSKQHLSATSSSED